MTFMDGSGAKDMKPIRIVVVDDSLTIRAMIETLLERDRRVEVVGIASNGDEAIAMIRLEKPDVVTLDIAMPGRDGLRVLDEIMDMDPCPVIMLSSLMRDGAPIVAEAMDRGAAACFNKAMIVREATRFVTLIQSVARGLIDAEAEPIAIAA